MDCIVYACKESDTTEQTFTFKDLLKVKLYSLLSFCDWLISLNQMSLRFIHVIAGVRISLRLNNIPIVADRDRFCLSIHLPTDFFSQEGLFYMSPTVGGQRGRHRQGEMAGNRVSAYPWPHPISLLLGPWLWLRRMGCKGTLEREGYCAEKQEASHLCPARQQ